MDSHKAPTEVVVNATVESYRWVRDYYTAVKNGQYRPFTALERKVREATRNEAWGPTGTMLNDLAEASFDEEACYVIFAIVDYRLAYPPEKWRNVYKALMVTDFLLKRGSSTWVTLSQNELIEKLGVLENFEATDEKGHDVGINVRHRSAAIRALLESPRLLSAEREAAAAKRKQYGGFSRDDLAAGRDKFSSKGGSSQMERASSWNYDREDGPGDFGNHGGFGNGASGNGRTPPSAEPSSSFRRQDSLTPSPAGLNAGEMKGVTLEENRKNLAALKEIMGRPENRTCADCAGGSSARPTWASINTGVFICMQCAGVHRGLGVHISKVRSCTLDTWLPEQVAFMSATGNSLANGYWEANLEPGRKPGSGDSNQLGSFIRAKYSGQWAEGSWPPPQAQPQAQQAPNKKTPPRPARSPAPQQQQPVFWSSFDEVDANDSSPAAAAAAAAPRAPYSAQTPSPIAAAPSGDFWVSFDDAGASATPPPPPTQPLPPPPQPQAVPPQEQLSSGAFWASFNDAGAAPPRPPPQPQAVSAQAQQPPGAFWTSFGDDQQNQPRGPAAPAAPQAAPPRAPERPTASPQPPPPAADPFWASLEDLASPQPPQAQPPAAANGLGSTLGFRSSPQHQQGPSVQQRWRNQVTQLKELGFTDELLCCSALEASGGDVNAAAEKLFLGAMDAPPPPAAAAQPNPAPPRAFPPPPPQAAAAAPTAAPALPTSSGAFWASAAPAAATPPQQPFFSSPAQPPAQHAQLPPLIDLLSLDDEPTPPSALLPVPTVPLFSERTPTRAAATPAQASDLGGLEELASNPNLMDDTGFFMPQAAAAITHQHAGPATHPPAAAPPAAQPDPFGSTAAPAWMSNGFTGTKTAAAAASVAPERSTSSSVSVVHGLDDLLSYQYTGADVRNTRLDVPVSQPSQSPFSQGQQMQQHQQQGHGTGNYSYMARAGLPGGGAAMQQQQQQHHQGRTSGMGLTVFNNLQTEMLSSYNISSAGGGMPMQGRPGSQQQPMRGSGR